ncbi:LOW QUALITY PROTEIN: glypican-2 [Sarcophilus harrisii]
MTSLRSLLLLLLSLCPGWGGRPGQGREPEATATRSCAETWQMLGPGYSLNLLPPTLISEFLQESLFASEHSLSQLLSRSYGCLFVQHAPVFGELFSQPCGHSGTSTVLYDALSEFWSQLLEKAFLLLYPQYSCTPDYLLCLAHLSASPNGQLQPFGPQYLHLQVTRVLAVHNFIQGLATGRDVISSALKVSMSEGCVQTLIHLTSFSLCQGAPSFRPCKGFCLNVAGSLSGAWLDPDWRSYLDTLLLLAERLRPFSFEIASESIGVKISEGLMFLQENSMGVSAQVFQGCGDPHPAPACSRTTPSPQVEVNQLWTFPPEEEWLTTAAGTNLPWLVRETYLPSVVGNYLAEQIKNSELEVNISGLNLSTKQQRLQLGAATARMREAALGHDLDLQDADEDANGSGERQHYADTVGATAVVLAVRPPRSNTPVVKGSGGSSHYNYSGARNKVVSRNLPIHPLLLP